MAIASVLNDILTRGEQAGKYPSLERNSANWFRTQAAKATTSPTSLINSDRQRFRKAPMIGDMYLYAYDPKTKADLPYYDKFPLVLPFASSKISGRADDGNGFYGLNMHYLPPRLRARLLDTLLEYVSNDKMNETTRIKFSYSLLNKVSSLKFFRPCVKKYLFSHMRSKFFYIEPKEWDIALFLPLDRFVGASKNTIYKESRDRIY